MSERALSHGLNIAREERTSVGGTLFRPQGYAKIPSIMEYRENITLHRITSLETDIAFVYTVRTYLHTLAHIHMRVHMLYIHIYIRYYALFCCK